MNRSHNTKGIVMKPARIVILILPILLYGCYGSDTSTRVTPITKIEGLAPTTSVEVFFEDTKPTREFVQLAFLEVIGTRYEWTDTLLTLMKKRAQTLGADAIVYVKKNQQERARGDIISKLANKDSDDIYMAPVLTGVAVKYK